MVQDMRRQEHLAIVGSHGHRSLAIPVQMVDLKVCVAMRRARADCHHVVGATEAAKITEGNSDVSRADRQLRDWREAAPDQQVWPQANNVVECLPNLLLVLAQQSVTLRHFLPLQRPTLQLPAPLPTMCRLWLATSVRLKCQASNRIRTIHTFSGRVRPTPYAMKLSIAAVKSCNGCLEVFNNSKHCRRNGLSSHGSHPQLRVIFQR
mmetsp:Transcript_2821/g.11123  ORF Transcript_2821/g.11123 Transcript_2821/m.11123 type:complete len:207 (-) Transcript_2821:263-883(-)